MLTFPLWAGASKVASDRLRPGSSHMAVFEEKEKPKISETRTKKHEIPMEPMPTDWSPARSHWAMCAVLHPTKQSSFCGDPVPHPKLKNSEAVKE